MKDDRFGKTIPSDEVIIPQVDLYKIHHFDNQAKRTSLKILKFNMRLSDLQDMPFEIGTYLTDDQIDTLVKYNIDDTLATKTFYLQSVGALELREKMGIKYNTDFTNFNDSKIGSEIFINDESPATVTITPQDDFNPAKLQKADAPTSSANEEKPSTSQQNIENF